ncbi:uncharacterized protein OCT59_005466 [Rhizophagus irregularis]|uniref:Uncharacterized protein n=2 Tax=Rhizophagus irregularis TaxID=588596 RepID=A0A2H5TTJ6_RHIID|nr:hypothetical protein GLOIN_2v1783411 [Rhizophagus irregularis DAOM 181602=DAOM 197198]POG64050.1 hypothetical protein GLOIN_2v1783411 [Rhizophagus irregularis DAOM 181602=DAOM 197198]UZO13994.1 hypothetical protein OCT59_005466 [Rhizophagus irregularis]GBC45902.1 hypothetical protein GLOIN_2v1783411 [Rhizophagus irregularis DAOM 181602=DAOM 197198]|eukprot:XP_025170916.1 hypothetical protein GLOIN_2v1783411 [Rhizophagus irregularis DAOM 181602=DAOM 197198]
MKTDLFSVLSRDLNELFNDHEEQNVVIQVGDEVNYKEFYAHSIILRARCKYFKSGLSCDWVKREGNRIIFKKPNITPEVFEVILKYIYSATISYEKYDVMHLLDVLVAADELLLSEMAESIQEYLLNHKADWLQKNFTTLWRKSREFDWCGKVQECCQSIVCNEPHCLFESPEFLTLEENLVIAFLKLDNLIMEEIEIWNYLLKWGKAQIPPKEDGSPAIDDCERNWSEKDIKALGEALKGCIPHIRWFHIEPSELFNKIWPLKEIFPQDLLEEIFRHHFTPNLPIDSSTFVYYKPQRPLPFESTILQQHHIAKLANWIDRKEGDNLYTYFTMPYNFKLLVRGSRDGFGSGTFHDKCDSKGASIVVMRIRGTNEILGGYNPVHWMTGNGHLTTEDSFIFNLGRTPPDNNVEEGLSPYTWYNLNGVKISRPRRPEYAVRIKDRTCGPCFGDKDLWMTSNFNEDENCSAVKDDYDFEITSTEKFAVDEYEVFQVLKKVVIKDASNSVTTNNNENENLLGGGDDATVDATNDVDVGTVNDVNDVNDDGIDTTNAAITTNTTNVIETTTNDDYNDDDDDDDDDDDEGES